MKKIGLFLLLLCVSGFSMDVTDAEKNLQADPAKGIEDAVILVHKGEIDDTFTTTLSKEKTLFRLKILSRKGVEDWGTVKISYDPQEENIGDIQAFVWNPDGTVHELNKDDIHKKKVSRKWGWKETEISFALPGVTEGSVVEYSYYRTYRETQKVYNWYSQHEIYCMHSEVTFIPWPTSRWGYTGGNMHARPSLETGRKSGQKAVTYVSRNIPPLPREEFAPPYNTVREYVSFYYTDSDTKYDNFWIDWGKDYYSVFIKKRMKKCSASKKVVEAELGGVQGNQAIDLCYDYVIANYKPLDKLSKAERAEIDKAYIKKFSRADTTAQIMKLPYLLPVQMNWILASLIQTAVPEAKVSLALYTPWNRRLFNKDLKTMSQMSGSMLRVECEGTVRWLSAGKGLLKAGDIEYGAYEVPILMMDGDGVRFEQMKPPAADKAVTSVKTDVYVEDEQVRMKRTTTYDVYESYDLRAELMYYTDDEVRDVLKEGLEDQFGESVTLKHQQVLNLKDIKQPLVVEEEFSFPYELEEMGDKIFFKMVGMSRYVQNPFNTEKRRTYIVFPYPRTIIQDLTYHLPEYFALESLPAGDEVRTPAMNYTVVTEKVDDRTFTVSTKEVLKSNMFSAQAHGNFKDLFNRIMSMSSPKAVLTELD